MKKILIIGGTEFLGFNLLKLLNKNYKIISISLKKPKKSRKIKKVEYLRADISKINSLNKIKKKISKVNFVFNFGGHVIHDNKEMVYKTHYIGAKNLMNFYLTKKIDLFIQIGSSMEYGKISSPQKEENICKPISHYGKAKLLATKYAKKLFKLYKFPVVIFRPYQVYGPNQDNNRLIPFTIHKCIKGENFPCSSGEQHRDFLYISDFVKCLKLCLKNKKSSGEIFNIGQGKAIKIKNVILSIIKKVNNGYPEFGKIKLRKEESKLIFPDVNKIKRSLKWKAKINFDKGINKTVTFYKKNQGIN